MDHVFVTLLSKAHIEGLLAFTNRNVLSTYYKSFEYDDTLIPEPLKEKFIYEPNKKIFHQIIFPLSEINLDI
uniref:GNAT family N-acetyltransferase n=1 Tax=Strongyloides papillosus TaxID=174720 RepID=A0A0N5B401_STREA